jgi:hypothetical protein
MFYTNQITKIIKNLFWPYQTISEVVLGVGLVALSKKYLIPIRRSPMANETCFLIAECSKFRVVILSESATGKKNYLIISKSGIFGVFTIID